VRLLHFHRAQSLLEEQERELLQAYARYGKQRWKKKRDQMKERLEKQGRRLFGQKHP
jgi:hypothetical protein